MSITYNVNLIVSEAASQKVKDLIDLLKAIGNASSTEHSFEYWPSEDSRICSIYTSARWGD